MPRAILGDILRPLIEKLARRRVGLLAVELADQLELSDDAARRFLTRLVADGTLVRPGTRRRRPEIFGSAARGAGGFVFFAPRQGGSFYARERRLDPRDLDIEARMRAIKRRRAWPRRR